MVEQTRTQLFMMLVQQAGSASLPLSNLSAREFLPFFRQVEESVAVHKLSPVIVYWSSHDVKWLISKSSDYKKLTGEANCVSLFSESQIDKPHEFCFLVYSQGISMVVYGRCLEESSDIFQCVGSIDPHIVKQAFQSMMPLWQIINSTEANRLEDICNAIGNPVTAPHFVSSIRNSWPVVKQRSIAPDKGLTTTEVSFSKPGSAKSLLASTLDNENTGLDTNSLINPQQVILPGVVNSSNNSSKPIFVSQNELPKQAVVPNNVPELYESKTLREIWTNIAQEASSVFAPDAQRIIKDIVFQLRISSDLPAILQIAIEELTKLGKADRGLIWQIIDDQLVVTNEYAQNEHECFLKANLSAQESTALVSEFLSRYPDETGSGVVSIPDTRKDTKLHRLSATLSSLLELGDVRARLVAQIRCRGVVHGFLELQQSQSTHDWSEKDAAILQNIAEVLSLVVQQSFDLAKIEHDASQMKLVNEIASIFRESGGQYEKFTLQESLQLIANHIGFSCWQVYLLNEEAQLLEPQVTSVSYNEPISLVDKTNPFLQVYESGKLKIINLESSRKRDLFFNYDTALILPLMSEGERLGVVGFWTRKPGLPTLRPQDINLSMTVSSNLTSFIRADQAIAQIRNERARANLIISVSEKINESLKAVDPIFQTLVTELANYFSLDLCSVSIYDGKHKQFTQSWQAGKIAQDKESPVSKFTQQLFTTYLDKLEAIPILDKTEIAQIATSVPIIIPSSVNSAVLIPIMIGKSLKGALCLISSKKTTPSVPDMAMIKDLLDRAAMVITHKELFEQVELLAVTDPLTGVFNKRYFEEQMNKELERYQRFGRPFSYIIADMDYLKKANDTYGHEYGSTAIKLIASTMKKCTRDLDTVARYGGEEFVVLLPETSETAAKVVADRICTSLKESKLEYPWLSPEEPKESLIQAIKKGLIDPNDKDIVYRLQNFKVTVSIGVATFPDDAQDKESIYKIADKALYLAKQRGRAQVCVASSDLPDSKKNVMSNIMPDR